MVWWNRDRSWPKHRGYRQLANNVMDSIVLELVRNHVYTFRKTLHCGNFRTRTNIRNTIDMKVSAFLGYCRRRGGLRGNKAWKRIVSARKTFSPANTDSSVLFWGLRNSELPNTSVTVGSKVWRWSPARCIIFSEHSAPATDRDGHTTRRSCKEVIKTRIK